MYSFKTIYFLIFLITLHNTNAKISDKRECVDSKCEEPISKAKTLMPYNSIEAGVLSFKANVEVTVFSYGAGERADWWGIELNGQRGYVPKRFLRETKMINKPTLLVDTEINSPQVPSDKKKQVIPQKVLEPFDIIDGTTIFHDSNIAPSSTVSPILPTATSVSNNKSNVNENIKKSVEYLPPSSDSISKVNDEEASVEAEEANEEYDVNDDDDDDNEDDDGDIDGEDEEELKSVYQETDNHKSSLKNPIIDEITTARPIVEKMLKEDTPDIPTLDPIIDQSKTASAIVEKELKEETPDIPALDPTTNNIYETLKTAEPSKEQEIEPQALSNKENNVEPLVLSTTLLNHVEVEKDKDVINKKNAASESFFVAGDESDDILKSPSPEDFQQEVVDVQRVLNNTVTADTLNIVDQITPEVPSHPVPSSDIIETKEETRPENKDIDVNLSNESRQNTNETPKSSIGDHNNTNLESEPSFIFEDNKHSSPSDIKLDYPLPIFGNVDSTTMGSVIEQSKQDVETDETKPIDNNETISEFSSGSSFEQSNQEVVASVVISKDNTEDMQSQHSSEINMSSVNEQFNNNSYEAPDINEDSSGDLTPNPIVENDIQENVNSEADSGGIINNFLSFFTQDDNSKIKQNTGFEETKPDEREVSKKEESSEVPLPYPEKEESSEVPLAHSLDQEIKPNLQDTVSSENNHNEHSTEPGVEYTFTEESLPQHHAIDKNSNEMIENHNIKDKIQNDGSTDILEDDDMKKYIPFEFPSLLPSNDLHSDFFVYILTTAISVILFLFGYLAMDKSKRVGPLIARINRLEQQLLITMKENEMLQESATSFHIHETSQVKDNVSTEQIEQLTQKLADMHITKTTLEEQIQALEKELDTSTEVGMELNKIVSDMLNSSNNGSDVIKESIEQMKRQLLEQQDTINSVNQTLSFTETENHELRLDLEISNKKVSDLQLELDKMAEKVLKIEEEKDQQQHTLELEIVLYQQKYNEANGQGDILRNEIQVLRDQLAEALRETDIKVKEFNELKSSLKDIKAIKNNSEAMKSLLEVSSIKAELHQLKIDSSKYKEQLRLEQEAHLSLGKQYQSLVEDTHVLREKYDFADKEKLEVKTKLDVLNNYFKEKESQMQREISKYESLWAAKEGEATSTTERVKYMQDELQNYKSQNETLKQEIMNQEVELKSQISVLEKKVHENWVTNRQLERKLEEAKQEAAQLRNRLTLSERAVTEGNAHMRILPPIQNGDLPFSPLPIESPASPPLIYGGRDHITQSPPLGGLPPPPPFLQPPIGGPFMPPHLPGMPPFMPPPPSMFPGDHRPPPLGRMSSPPPMMMRYSPESTAYSGYERNSPSPPYDSEYGASPPPMRSYSPYERENRREYKRPHNRSKGRANKGSNHLNSGSGRSNDSLDELYSKPSKKV